MDNKLAVISKKYLLILITKNKYIWYRNGNIYESSSEDRRDIHFVKKIYQTNSTIKGTLKSIFIKLRLFQRVLRLQPRAVAYADNGKISFAYNRNVFVWDTENNTWDISAVRPEMRTPLDIVYISGVNGFVDSFVYGEYGWNDDREEVHIWQYVNGKWNICHTFGSNTICHVHALIPDRKHECVYIMTGDRDSESGIWRATQNFQTVEPVILGNQQYRSCAGVVQNDEIIFATDTPVEKNYLYKMNMNKEICEIAKLPGSVINSSQIGRSWWFATAVEQDPNLPHIQHCISCKKAPGIEDRFVHIFQKKPNQNVLEIAKLKKDILPMWLFQFGNTYFVKNYKDDSIYIIPIAVYKYGQKTVRIILNGEK